jgi:hypothetical protein
MMALKDKKQHQHTSNTQVSLAEKTQSIIVGATRNFISMSLDTHILIQFAFSYLESLLVSLYFSFFPRLIFSLPLQSFFVSHFTGV